MADPRILVQDHLELTRRYFLGLGTAGIGGLVALPAWADSPDGKLPPVPLQLDAGGRPREWPMRYAIAHWVYLVTDVPPGRYHLRCRTIDARGAAQPMPRPFPKSGNNGIQRAEVVVES